MNNCNNAPTEPIDIIPSLNIKQSFYNFLENIELNKEERTKYTATASPMKKTLSLDTFWPNTPPSFSPKESFLSKIKNILNTNVN